MCIYAHLQKMVDYKWHVLNMKEYNSTIHTNGLNYIEGTLQNLLWQPKAKDRKVWGHLWGYRHCIHVKPLGLFHVFLVAS